MDASFIASDRKPNWIDEVMVALTVPRRGVISRSCKGKPLLSQNPVESSRFWNPSFCSCIAWLPWLTGTEYQKWVTEHWYWLLRLLTFLQAWFQKIGQDFIAIDLGVRTFQSQRYLQFPVSGLRGPAFRINLGEGTIKSWRLRLQLRHYGFEKVPKTWSLKPLKFSDSHNSLISSKHKYQIEH